MTGRRTRLLAVGLALLALSGAYVAGNAGFVAADHHEVFSVRQNGGCFDVAPLGDGSRTVESFYDYRRGDGTEYSSYGTTGLQANQVSRLFVYRGSGGTSLVMVHDQLGGEGGGAVTFHVSGLPADGSWAVVDDTYNRSDDRFQASSTGAEIDWMWSDNRTDGAAFRGLASHGYDAITIEPFFNGESWAATGRSPRWPYADDGLSWQLLDADGSTVALDRTRPVEIRPGPCTVATTTSTATPAPTPSPTRTTTTSPTPTATTDPTPTGTPTATATATATPAPTTAPEPTATATSTPTPTPSPTTIATQTPSPTPTSAPTPTPSPTPANSGGGGGGGGGGGSGGGGGGGGGSNSAGGSSGSGTGGASRGYDSNGGPDEGTSQETLPEMSVDVTRPDDDAALVAVSDPAAGNDFEVGPLASDGAVVYRSLNLSFDASDDFEVAISASEPVPPGMAAPSPDRDGIEALSYLSVDRDGLADENVTGATLAFAIDESTLDERGVAPGEVAVYRRVDGEWRRVPTELAGETDGGYEYVARSSTLSSVVVAADRPSLAVTDVRVSEAVIAPGEVVEIEAVVENTGKAAGTATLNLTAFETVVDSDHVRVPAGQTRTLAFTQRFDAPGEYTVAVAGIEAQVQVESTTSSPTATTPDATTGSGQPGFGWASMVLVVVLIGLVVVYGLRDVV